jgi:uncharacterized membrane protein
MHSIQIIVDKGLKCYLDEREWNEIREIEFKSQKTCGLCGKVFSFATRWQEPALANVFGYVCKCGMEFTHKDAAVRRCVVS